jgi:hypothetical protein
MCGSNASNAYGNAGKVNAITNEFAFIPGQWEDEEINNNLKE